MKKQSTNSSPAEEPSRLSSIIEQFVHISKLIPHEFENEFTNFKAETLKFIFRLQNRVPKAFQSTSPENKRLKTVETPTHISNFRAKDSNGETEETDFVFNTGELSRESTKNQKSKKKLLSRLQLNKIEDFSPILKKSDRNCVSSSRDIKAKTLFGNLRDSINPETDVIERKLKETLKIVRVFMINVQNLCENYPDSEEKIELVIKKCKDFNETLEKIANEEVFVTDEEIKLQEELKNCKKIALMYEKKLKLKNETISVLRNKEKCWIERNKKCKDILALFSEESLKKENIFFRKIVERIEGISVKFVEIEKKIRKNLELGLEEIKKAVEMTNKTGFFYEENEILQKQVEEMEFNNRMLGERNTELELELKEYRDKYYELENTVKVMKKYQDKNFRENSELEDLKIEQEKLKQCLKIKEFELKHKDFENSALGADKNELLSRVEGLEIEKIEANECINTLTIKYNQEIEHFVYNNTLQRNQIQALEKEKEEIINQKNNFQEKFQKMSKENCILNEKILKQTQEFTKNVAEIEKLRKEKCLLESKLARFEKILQEKETLEKTVSELKQSLNHLAESENNAKTFEKQTHENIIELTKALNDKNHLQTEKKELNEDAKLQYSDPETNFTEIKAYTEEIQLLQIDLQTLQSLNTSLTSELSTLKSLLSTPDMSLKYLSLKSKKAALKIKVQALESSLSEVSEQNKDLQISLQDFRAAQAKLEPKNIFLSEDFELQLKSYKEIIEGLKLDRDQYENMLKSYETKLGSLQHSCESLQSYFDSNLNEALSSYLSQIQTKESSFTIPHGASLHGNELSVLHSSELEQPSKISFPQE